MPPGRPEGWQPGGRPESAVACLCPRASGGAPPGPAAWRSSLAFGGVSRNQSANRAFRGDVSCCRFREIWVTVATIISPSPMLLSPGRWRLSGRVFSHTCQSNPRGREEMVCKSHVQPRLRVGSALLLSGSGLVPESQQRGAGALAGSASSPRLGFPEILPSCLSQLLLRTRAVPGGCRLATQR